MPSLKGEGAVAPGALRKRHLGSHAQHTPPLPINKSARVKCAGSAATERTRRDSGAGGFLAERVVRNATGTDPSLPSADSRHTSHRNALVLRGMENIFHRVPKKCLTVADGREKS